MKSKFVVVFLLISAIFTSCAMAKEQCPDEKQLLEKKRIDLDTKSLKGWIRLLNNRSKQGEYGVRLTREETIALLKCLTEELEYRKRTGKMS